MLLLHQSNALTPGITDDETKQQLIKQANKNAIKQLESFAYNVLPHLTNVQYLVTEKSLPLTVNELLKEPSENLVFIGIKNSGIIKNLFLGNTSVNIIETVKNIVVAMPKDISMFKHEKLYVAVSDKHQINVVGLNNFLNFIDAKNTCITFFYLAKPNEDTGGVEKTLGDLANLFSNKYKTQTAIYEGMHPFEDVKKVINKKEEEILIVQKGSRLLTDLLFRRFLINELVYEGNNPLVVIP